MTNGATHHNPDFWPNLLTEMRANGILYKQIAAHLHCHPTTISLWVSGENRPSFWHAIDLLAYARNKGVATAEREVAIITDRLRLEANQSPMP